eukprot:COSAG02_NODE_49893_length_324_cov_0.644444_1_plen_87_part_10
MARRCFQNLGTRPQTRGSIWYACAHAHSSSAADLLTVTLLHPQQGPAYGYNVHSIERSTAIKEIMPDVSEEALDKLIRSEWRGVDQS